MRKLVPEEDDSLASIDKSAGKPSNSATKRRYKTRRDNRGPGAKPAVRSQQRPERGVRLARGHGRRAARRLLQGTHRRRANYQQVLHCHLRRSVLGCAPTGLAGLCARFAEDRCGLLSWSNQSILAYPQVEISKKLFFFQSFLLFSGRKMVISSMRASKRYPYGSCLYMF